MTESFGAIEPIEDKYLGEILRYGGAKLHSVSAFLGGVAS